MRPSGRTGLDERLAVFEVRADRGRHDARRLRQRRDRIAILAVGDYERPVDAELGARLLELGLGAAAECDTDIGRRLPGEVPGREYSYEAGRPVDDDVVVANGLSHVSNLPSREGEPHRRHPRCTPTEPKPHTAAGSGGPRPRCSFRVKAPPSLATTPDLRFGREATAARDRVDLLGDHLGKSPAVTSSQVPGEAGGSAEDG